ncbi:lipid II:glycine glycyltransferase FemX [Agromyces aerolatus]|uniref:lipid II:glycine glycyltransferase FemX n=1 Tax=Agromyces sp. LY-1074 TaxID=3074080 RepID=UPI0028654243|nr:MULTISPECIES: peptidoglycan bridge formation glycyltransferase FemA/FemB family protein [unclassified Agromyces]MDR5699969.1 peptidoglycan bridge formation glycyltransferase FemA/FemB family protein [Agromyces sp. LY-1074]MDR5706219.1 peptidoglycan bridge formation glycyltransferase FemA/FemB family protein [Agromyces sp. LY-1358]
MIADTVARGRVTPDWDERVLASHSAPHFMQSRTWARIRSGGPWRVGAADLGVAAELPALVFEREAPGTGRLRHIPRLTGVTVADVPALTERVHAERGEAFATKLEIYQERDPGLDAAFAAAGWLPTRASQYRFAVVADLADGADEVLARMKKRARAEIRIGERNGVEVERVEVGGPGSEEMLALVRVTEERSGAFFRRDDYLRAVWAGFAADGRGELYLARHEGRVVSGAFIARYGPRAWYKDGGSLRDVPNLMASRLLQWRVMQELIAGGITAYDLGHVPPPDSGAGNGTGIQTFKTAFAPVVEFQPAYLLPHSPAAEPWRTGESRFLAEYHAATGDYWY